jgi:hypothetical protein
MKSEKLGKKFIYFFKKKNHHLNLTEQVEPGQTELVDVIYVFHLADTGVQGSGMNSDRPVTVAHAVYLPFSLMAALLFRENLLRMKLFEQ